MFISFNTKSKITRMVEKSKKVSGQIEVLKKQQKAASESLIKDNEAQKVAVTNSIEAQIASYKAQIETLKNQKETQCAACDQRLKVDLDRIINSYDEKILAKKNELNRLNNMIDAENKNNADVMKPFQTNAPTTKTILVETTNTKKSK